MSWETGWNSDTLRGRNLKTQFYLYGLAHRPHALIPLENGAFRNRFSNRKNLRTQLYFYDIGLPFLLIRHKNENFENVLQTGGIWKRWLCVFVWVDNILKTGALRKRWRHEKHVTSLTEFSSNAFLNSSGIVWTENIWCVLRVKPPFSNSSGVMWTVNIWCVFKVKPPFSNSSGVCAHYSDHIRHIKSGRYTECRNA